MKITLWWGWEGWCSNKIEGTWVPEAVQSTPQLYLVWATPEIPLHWFQRPSQESPLRGWGSETEKGKKSMGCTLPTDCIRAAGPQSQWGILGERRMWLRCPARGARELGQLYTNSCGNSRRDARGGGTLTPGRVLWGQREPQAGTSVRMSIIWVDRCDKSWGALAISSYICVCYIHPPLHPSVLAWNFRKDK